ncbi:hypothetical protein AAFF_G00016110 [Aldrovandia affinis]|uniref:Uncharacterized protein n=1 Tax=Aldrovandia affinis TaxID=143900 RepID=A0AAD7S5Z8_9TELE|nr:hypothetical protein AAFF_G00016110 [Aldrovandia affinis]
MLSRGAQPDRAHGSLSQIRGTSDPDLQQAKLAWINTVNPFSTLGGAVHMSVVCPHWRRLEPSHSSASSEGPMSE